MSVPSCSTELLLYPSRPTQKAAREVVEVQLTPGSVQLPVTVLKPLPVSAYPDQFVLWTWVNPLIRSAGRDTRWSAAWWVTSRFGRPLPAAPQQILNSDKSTINNVTENLTDQAARNGLLRQLSREKIRRKNRNTFSTSRKIDAAISGAEARSVERRRRWKSTTVSPAKITRPSTE
jgi:hypothetical protein